MLLNGMSVNRVMPCDLDIPTVTVFTVRTDFPSVRSKTKCSLCPEGESCRRSHNHDTFRKYYHVYLNKQISLVFVYLNMRQIGRVKRIGYEKDSGKAVFFVPRADIFVWLAIGGCCVFIVGYSNY